MNIVINELTGIVLKTKNKVCEEDIIVTLDDSVQYKGEPGYDVRMRCGSTTSTLKTSVPIKINGSGQMSIAKGSIPTQYNQSNTNFMLYGVRTITFVGVSTYYTQIFFYKPGTSTAIEGLDTIVISPNGTEQTVTIPENVQVIIQHLTEPPTHSGGAGA